MEILEFSYRKPFRFKVGDKVKAPSLYHPNGIDIGIIKDINGCGRYTNVNVKFASGFTWWYSAEQLERLEDV